MTRCRQVIIFVLILWAGGLSLLRATQPFWSLEPSTQIIERADSLTGFDITKYEVELAIDDQTEHIQGSVTAYVFAEENLDGIEYELEGDSLNVTQVLVDGSPSGFTHQDGVIHISLSVSQGTNFTTTVSYAGVPSRSPAPYNIGMIFPGSYVYTLSNPDAGRYWWPSYDHPWDKALVDWHITVREDWLAATNGIRTGITDNGDGTRTHHWTCASPVATYVMGLAAGPYVEFIQQAGDIPIQNFVTQGQMDNAQVDFANVPGMIAFFSDIYGPYPFEKYGHMVVPMTTYAAMEHQTMTTFGSQYLTGNQNYESIVAHEFTHQWYGNYVTPITMREVWLKESFATYSEFLWEAHHEGWQAGCDYLRENIQQYYISWANNNGAHTIFDPEYNLMFAPPTYEKSASILHMLRLKIGNDDYFDFIGDILATYPDSNLNTAEFIDLAEQASGQDLTQFFQQWIYSPGIPNATFTVLHNDSGMGKIIGTTTSDTDTQFFLDVPIHIPGSAVADSVVIHADPAGCVNYFPIGLEDDVAGIRIDPNHWVLTRSFSQNSMQLANCLAYNGAVDLTWFEFEAGIPLAGYHIYRRELPSGDFICITDAPLAGLSHTDATVANGNVYEYYVVAVDTEDYQSLPSNLMQAEPIDFPFDEGFLVVDETRDGNGANISPTDAEADAFYADVLQDFYFTQWDIDLQQSPTLADLSHHPLVLWHSDDFSDIQLLENLDLLGSYVLSGGKLLISGWKYPSVFDAAFLNKFLPGITPVLNNSAVLVSAESDFYPDLHPDPAKLATPWNGMLPMSYVFSGATNVLYTAVIADGSPNDGEPLVIRVEHNGSLALLGFPLYFMLQGEARAFLSQFLPEFYPPVENQEDLLPPPALSLRCQPNPFAGRAEIAFSLPRDNTPVRISIYNLRGQKIASLGGETYSKGAHSVIWNGRDASGRKAAAGIYIIELKTPKERRILRAALTN